MGAEAADQLGTIPENDPDPSRVYVAPTVLGAGGDDHIYVPAASPTAARGMTRSRPSTISRKSARVARSIFAAVPVMI